MIIEPHQVIEEFIANMRITRSVQTGFLNVPMTNMLADKGEVVVITPATFNPFEDNKAVTLLNVPFNSQAKLFNKKYGILDVCVFGHIKSPYDIADSIKMWTPSVRKNGVMVFLNSEDEVVDEILEDYIKRIGEEYFEVTKCADITFIRVK